MSNSYTNDEWARGKARPSGVARQTLQTPEAVYKKISKSVQLL